MPVRIHLGTDQVDAALDLGRRAGAALPDGGTTAVLRLDRPIATAFGDRFVLRRPSPGEALAGGRVLDPLPPRGISRRRTTAPSLAALATAAGSQERLGALVALHGLFPAARAEALAAVEGAVQEGGTGLRRLGPALLADDLEMWLEEGVIELASGSDSGISVAEVRRVLAGEIRRRATVDRGDATLVIDAVVAELAAAGRVRREGDRLRAIGASTGPTADVLAAMARLEAALDAPAPPGLAEAARSAGCPPEGIRALEAAGRIVRVEDDLAWSASLLRRFETLALELAATAPLSPAAYRDATGTSRRYALAILEDLDRRAILRRTPAGHVRGPRAPTATAASSGR
jgi:selenocysteine-specific elongation factor